MTASQKTVFVIADRDALRFLVRILRESGFRAMGVSDAESARAALEPLAPDLVIAAYPGLEEEEADLTGVLLRAAGTTRFRAIALLASRDDRLAAAALADGFADVCAQPLAASDVLVKVSRLLLQDPAEPEPTG